MGAPVHQANDIPHWKGGRDRLDCGESSGGIIAWRLMHPSRTEGLGASSRALGVSVLGYSPTHNGIWGKIMAEPANRREQSASDPSLQDQMDAFERENPKVAEAIRLFG